jgi:hypothetical protein
MNVFRRISRAIARFNDRVGPLLAAGSAVRSEAMAQTEVDPRALNLLQHELDQERSEEPE